MYQQFLQNAARNALAANDLGIYERAFQSTAHSLGGEQSARNLQVPTPKMLARKLGQPLVWALDMQEFCLGLWLAEWALDNPKDAPRITWQYWPKFSQQIAQEMLFEGSMKPKPPTPISREALVEESHGTN